MGSLANKGKWRVPLFMENLTEWLRHVAVVLNDLVDSAVNKWDAVFPKGKTYGLKVDVDNPTFPWKDLLGAISIRGTGATDPSYNVYRGSVRGYQFDAGEEVFIEFHVPHDHASGTDIYIHFHHSVNGKNTAGVSAGTIHATSRVTWAAEWLYSKGHNQQAFSSPLTITATSSLMSKTLYQHYITEVQLSAGTPAANQLDTDLIEPDGLLLVRGYLLNTSISASSGVTKAAPFLHFIDIHYQSTNIGTKSKSPDFWT